MEEELKKKQEKKAFIIKIVKILAIIIITGLVIAGIVLYRENREVQNFFDENIFRKTVEEGSLVYIETSNDSNTHICAFDNYIGILSNNILTAYNTYGKQEFTLNLTITTPIFATNGKYLAVAEKNGNKIYLISDKNIVWQTDVEGKIEKITVNKNGYVAISETQTSYKTVVIAYTPTGKELCKTYLSVTYAVDMEISNDNKNLAIAETNLSGIQIKSGIRIISLEKVEQDAENAVIYKEDIGADCLITSIHYDKQNNLICMLDDKIIKIEENEIKDLAQYDGSAIFADIELGNQIVQVINEGQEEIQTRIQTTNTSNGKGREYIINSIPKEIDTKDDVIAINTGSEAYFLTSTGFLIAKYEAKQEIKEIVMTDNFAGIIYKNKIEIIKL